MRQLFGHDEAGASALSTATAARVGDRGRLDAGARIGGTAVRLVAPLGALFVRHPPPPSRQYPEGSWLPRPPADRCHEPAEMPTQPTAVASHLPAAFARPVSPSPRAAGCFLPTVCGRLVLAGCLRATGAAASECSRLPFPDRSRSSDPSL